MTCRLDNGSFTAYDPTNTQTNLFTGTSLSSRSIDTFGAAARVGHGDLTALLYLQGYAQDDFVERKDP